MKEMIGHTYTIQCDSNTEINNVFTAITDDCNLSHYNVYERLDHVVLIVFLEDSKELEVMNTFLKMQYNANYKGSELYTGPVLQWL